MPWNMTGSRESDAEPRQWPSPRGMVLTVLGVITLGVAILSVAVSYDILEPRFGAWAVPTVGALDALWVVFQATEILAGNHRRRARRVQVAGLALTAVNAAIPTLHLIFADSSHFDLAFVITPLAIVATKGAWWLAMPSLGRKVSTGTRQRIGTKRQTVADQLEEMEAEAAHRIELLALATTLEEQVAEAEQTYRQSKLRIQQQMVESLHQQAVDTEKAIAEKALPASVAAIQLPELGTWTPAALALPGTPLGTVTSPELTGRDTDGTQVRALLEGTGTPGGTPDGTPDEDPAHAAAHAAIAELAAVAGVPAPQPGGTVSDEQMDVVLRHLRYSEAPPDSYRSARDAYRALGFVGSEERIRISWNALIAKEHGARQSDDADMPEDTETEPEDTNA
ncbi:hypothetical protein OG985_48750 (plasmid) [Streptomyces sp. NBC_00289]|uniref:hypothetical protein n=1 Tax=Streptomyces sp. NBC_00289 TaxID=2975703 RepID=UPI003243A4EE